MFFSFHFALFSQQKHENHFQKNPEIHQLEIPKTNYNDKIIHHLAYALSYNSNYKQANWIAYELTGKETEPLVKRSNHFVTDPELSGICANNDDYKKSGYDRGHLAPAADMAWSETSMKESFFFSNISPQIPEFNRGIWKESEELVRNWAKDYQKIQIVTGPVFSAKMKSIGPHQVSVPESFYKIILKYNDSICSGIGFIIPNKKSSEPLQTFAVSIDFVEHSTGIDFFPALPDHLENEVESHFNFSDWKWQYKKSKSKKKAKNKK